MLKSLCMTTGEPVKHRTSVLVQIQAFGGRPHGVRFDLEHDDPMVGERSAKGGYASALKYLRMQPRSAIRLLGKIFLSTAMEYPTSFPVQYLCCFAWHLLYWKRIAKSEMRAVVIMDRA
jgi:hypothetical protein